LNRLNLGIVAHVDAGKTSLTERMLYAAGVIAEVGSVDAGSTQTDSLALERQRGITIRAAVVSFEIGGTTVNLVDTPGHPDFIAEVDRALGVLDGAVLVISAVEGVQAQTRVLFRALERLRIPSLLFVNKIDRSGAREESLLAEIAAKLTPAVVPMGRVRAIGTTAADYEPFREGDPGFSRSLLDVLTDGDPALLMRFVERESDVTPRQLRRSLERQSRAGRVHPVFFGSAITGAGIAPLMEGIRGMLPGAPAANRKPLAGTVFKIERGPSGEKIAVARLRSGSLSVRDTIPFGANSEGKVTALSVYERGGTMPRTTAEAGEIARITGLAEARVGDTLGHGRAEGPGTSFARPTLETVISTTDPMDTGRLHSALSQLAEQDPLIDLRQDDLQRELSVSFYGEVQKEVIQATLESDYRLDVDFRETTVIHIERPSGTGQAAQFKYVAPNPFLATVGLRIEPAPGIQGVGFELDSAVLGTMPLAFFKAVEETVVRTLRQGLNGWQVDACRVTMTHSGYAPRQSHAHQKFSKSMSSTGEDFRGLTPLVVMEALQAAGTIVYEPFEAFRLEVPADAFLAVAPLLAHLRAILGSQETRGSHYLVEGELPASSVRSLQMRLPGLTRGEGVLECSPGGYHPVRGTPPERRRWDQNPLNPKEYLLHVQRRV